MRFKSHHIQYPITNGIIKVSQYLNGCNRKVIRNDLRKGQTYMPAVVTCRGFTKVDHLECLDNQPDKEMCLCDDLSSHNLWFICECVYYIPPISNKIPHKMSYNTHIAITLQSSMSTILESSIIPYILILYTRVFYILYTRVFYILESSICLIY